MIGVLKVTLSRAKFTGKDSIESLKDFLNNPPVQEQQARAYKKKQWEQLVSIGGDRLVDTRLPDGTQITPSGLLGGAHLLGAGGIVDSIKLLQAGGREHVDGNGTNGSKYIKALNGLNIGSEIAVDFNAGKPSKKADAQTDTDLAVNSRVNNQDIAISRTNSWVTKKAVVMAGVTLPAGTEVLPALDQRGSLLGLSYTDAAGNPISLNVQPSRSTELAADRQEISHLARPQAPTLKM